jgi:signal transduction histidine kinase
MILNRYGLAVAIGIVFSSALTLQAHIESGNKITYSIQINSSNEFDELIIKFNKALDLKNRSLALTYLNRAEHLLIDLKDVNILSMYAILANSYAKVRDVQKTRYYQQRAATTYRGNRVELPISSLNELAKSYIILNDTSGMKKMFESAIIKAAKINKHPIKIAYVNSLFDINDNLKASTLLTELYNDTPLGAAEQAEILSLLIINSIKLGQFQRLNQFYNALEQLKTAPTAHYYLAKGMYLEFKGQYGAATLNYNQLLKGFTQGKRANVYLDGILQLAQLHSRKLQKDSASYFFSQLANALQKPLKSSAIGIRYLKAYQAHQLRFNSVSSVEIDEVLSTKDSLYKNELAAVTKELQYRYKIEQDKQKAELIRKQRAVEILTYEKRKQRLLLIISGLSLLIISGCAVIYILYQRRKQSSLLHLAELERLKQLHKTEVIKKLSSSQEAERWRIADQLHDEVGSMISVVRLNLSEHPLKKEVISAEKLATANRVLANVADTVREMSHQLMPVAIRQYGLINAIEQLITDINTSGKIYIEHLIYGFDNLSKYPEDFQVSFYRIVQELFQNIVKHAKASNAIFQLIEHPDSINLYIEDNGRGIENDNKDRSGKGIGLLTNRIDYFDGKISIEGHPGKGTLIVIDIPTARMIEDGKEAMEDGPLTSSG